MSKTLQPSVAGLFYPAEAEVLREEVRGFLARPGSGDDHPKAIVAPHAGYLYSGAVAGSAYARVAPIADRIRRVVLLGPAHRHYIQGLAFSAADYLNTPLGPVAVDRDAWQAVQDLPQLSESDQPFLGEHCLEVQLPFLQLLLDDFRVAPMVVGDATPAQVAEVLERLWGDESTLIVISSDLSHFHDYETARDLDSATSRAIETLAPEAIGHDQACGSTPLNGLLLEARKHGLNAVTVDLRNSGDAEIGSKYRVVGYGAYVFQ